MDLHGKLSDGGLASLLQYLAMNNVTGVLTLRQFQGTKSYIFFREGKLVHAGLGEQSEAGVRTDIDALAVLLSWGEGRFSFHKDIQAPIESQKLPLEQALLEATRRVDESKRLGRLLLHEDTVLSLKPLGPDISKVSLSVGAIQFMGFLNGRDNLRDLAYKRQLPLENVLAYAEELIEHDLATMTAVLVSPVFVADLKYLLIDFLGPVGSILLEDVLYELNLSDKQVPERLIHDVIGSLRKQLESEGSALWFERESRKLCSHYGITVFA